jgi:ATPase family associated with various cellular activities (AAA)
MSARHDRWFEENRVRLFAETARLARRITGEDEVPEEAPQSTEGRPYRVELLAERLGLSGFERKLLVMVAGFELDRALAAALGEPPNAATALALFDDAHWSAFSPDAPLRRWGLVAPSRSGFLQAPLMIDAALLPWLLGTVDVSSTAPRTAIALRESVALPGAYRACADTVVARLQGGSSDPAFNLAGGDRAGRIAIAQAATEEAGLTPWLIEGSAIPVEPVERREWIRLWERELLLCGALPVIDPGEASPAVAAAFVDAYGGPLFVVGAVGETRRGIVRIDLPPVDHDGRAALWAAALALPREDADLTRLAYQFALSPADIAHAAEEARASADDEPLIARAWTQARARTRRDVGDFVRRVTVGAGLDDLVLPAAQRRTLDAIGAQVRNQATVYGAWAMGGHSSRGLGISALFSGPSGAGKTTAAEAMAGALGLDLLMVDLSQVVSKYIGETNKNLDRVFASAEIGGAVLLFDEADALFGKRSEVRDSHDRYANMEVSYLLQRMEAYRGLAILTTNQKGGIDDAFLRRIRFIVHFPFPDREMREVLWRRAIPQQLLAEQPDWAELARLSLAGGSIRNITLNAAFLAAEEGHGIAPTHLRRAIAAEHAKMEAPPMVGERGRTGT